VRVRFKIVSNEEHISLEAELVLIPYFPSHCSGVIEICHVALPAYALREVQVWLKSGSNEGHIILEAETVSTPYPPHIAVGSIKYAT
jgi:hypothetical protein